MYSNKKETKNKKYIQLYYYCFIYTFFLPPFYFIQRLSLNRLSQFFFFFFLPPIPARDSATTSTFYLHLSKSRSPSHTNCLLFHPETPLLLVLSILFIPIENLSHTSCLLFHPETLHQEPLVFFFPHIFF